MPGTADCEAGPVVPLDPVTETETEDVPATVAPLTAVASADFVITGGPTVPPLVPSIAVAVSSTTGSSTLSYVHRTAVVSPVSIDTTVNVPFAGAGPSAIACDVQVIEDDGAIRSVLDRGLRADGFDVEVCADGPSGLWKELEGGRAAIVLDLLLPGMSGYKVCEMVRAEGVTTPILVLTAKSGKYDQIDLLDAGADDFLIKSASIALISARLRALIRSASGSPSDDAEEALPTAVRSSGEGVPDRAGGDGLPLFAPRQFRFLVHCQQWTRCDPTRHRGRRRSTRGRRTPACILCSKSVDRCAIGGTPDGCHGTQTDNVVVQVDDDGPGIAEADRATALGRFGRLDEARQTVTGGSGLGLAIAASAAHAHGGDLRVGTADLGGARFQLFFPVTKAVARP